MSTYSAKVSATVLAVCFCVLGFGVGRAQAETNLIANPSVEQKTGALPTNWNHMKKGNNVSVFTYKAGGFQSSKSLYINVTKYTSGESYWYFKELPVTENTTYVYTEQYKSSVATKVYADIKIAGRVTTVFLADAPASNVWTPLTVNIVTPGGATSMTVKHVITGLGYLQADVFSLAEIASPPTTPPPVLENTIPNPSLEIVSDVDPSLPQHWTKTKTGSNNAQFTYLNTGHTGNRSVQVAITQYTRGLGYYMFDGAPVTGGKTYDYSFYYKSDSYAEVDASITLANGDVVYEYLGVSYPSSEWSKFSTRITLPDTAREVSIYNMLYSKGYLVTDDYALTLVTVVPFARPIVSLTFDDYFNSLYDTIYPMFKDRGLAATAYLVSGDFGQPNILSADKLKEIHNYGFEFGSHTVTHPHLPFISPAEVNYELSQSKSDIAQFTGVTPINFSSPYGEYNDSVKQQIAQYYRSHRSVDVGFNGKDNFDILNIKTMSVINTTTPEMVLSWVDEAIRDHTWLVLVYHDVIENGGTFSNSPEHLRTVLDGLVARGVSVKTVDSALNELQPQMQ